jgi:hypothetical protein
MDRATTNMRDDCIRRTTVPKNMAMVVLMLFMLVFAPRENSGFLSATIGKSRSPVSVCEEWFVPGVTRKAGRLSRRKGPAQKAAEDWSRKDGGA